MSHTHPYKIFVNKHVMPETLEGYSVLDCGCGRGNWGFFMRTEVEGRPFIEGFDLYGPYIERLKEIKLYDKIYRRDIRSVGELKKTYDLVLALDVLEHIEKDEAVKVIKTLERMTEKLLILSFPIGFSKQGIGYDGNIFQVHKSGFTPRELRAQGYETKAFFRFTRSMNLIQKIRCFILRLSFDQGRFVAWKRFSGSDKNRF